MQTQNKQGAYNVCVYVHCTHCGLRRALNSILSRSKIMYYINQVPSSWPAVNHPSWLLAACCVGTIIIQNIILCYYIFNFYGRPHSAVFVARHSNGFLLSDYFKNSSKQRSPSLLFNIVLFYIFFLTNYSLLSPVRILSYILPMVYGICVYHCYDIASGIRDYWKFRHNFPADGGGEVIALLYITLGTYRNEFVGRW